MNISCSSDFYLSEIGVCLPLCGKWKRYSETELKVLFTTVYYIVVQIAFLVSYTVSIRRGKAFGEELVKYFICESMGNGPGKTCSWSDFEGVDTSVPAIAIIMILTAVYPLVSLLYVIRLEDINTFLQRITSKSKRHETPHGETPDVTARPPHRPLTMDLLKGVPTSAKREENILKHENTAKENGIEVEPEVTHTKRNVGNYKGHVMQ